MSIIQSRTVPGPEGSDPPLAGCGTLVVSFVNCPDGGWMTASQPGCRRALLHWMSVAEVAQTKFQAATFSVASCSDVVASATDGASASRHATMAAANGSARPRVRIAAQYRADR